MISSEAGLFADHVPSLSPN